MLDKINFKAGGTRNKKGHFIAIKDFPGGPSGKEAAGQCRRHKRHRFNSWVRKIP